ncbi:MAG: glycosyltransferase [Lysobacterales bacterium]
MSHRLLIICPHFAPTNAADSHRVRICAEGLLRQGWELDLIACRPEDLPINQTPLLNAGLPQQLRVHRVPSQPNWLGRLVGSQTTGRNARRFIEDAGDRLLAEHAFDGVFFSTTAFGLLPLAVRWKEKFNVPYVVDLQDPWLQTLPAGVPAPGGRLRFALAMSQAKKWESTVVQEAAGIVSVSPAYGDQLRQRYPDLRPPAFLTLPFGASTQDIALAQSDQVSQTIFDPVEPNHHLVHVGRGGEDLWPSLLPLLHALPSATSATLHLIGTSYAPQDRQQKTLWPLAEQLGVANQVQEYTNRIDYFEAIRCLTDSTGIVVLTSADPAYNASKIHNCLLAGPPVLALVHPNSVAQSQWQNLAPHLTLVDCLSNDAQTQVSSWLKNLPMSPTRMKSYPFEARTQSEALGNFLSQVLLPSR